MTSRPVAFIATIVVGIAGLAGAVRHAPAGPEPVAKAKIAVDSNLPVAAAATVGSTSMSRSTPVRLTIPAIGVDSGLMALGLASDGTMEVPPAGFPAGWYIGGPTPGELGPAVIAGHVDWTGPGVFYDLHNLVPGDAVTVTREDGTVAAFRVTRVAQFAKDEFPTDEVYGNLDHAGLRLITCGGLFNARTGHYDDNVVVFAAFVGPVH